MTPASSRRLRIGVVVDSLDGERNGVVNATRRLIAGLRERHQVTEIVGGGEPGPDRVCLPTLRIPGIHQLIAQNGMQLARPVLRTLRRAIAAQDVVQIQMPYVLGSCAMAIANALHVPAVLTYHVQVENWLYQVGIRSQLVSDLISHFSIATLFNRAQAVVCLNSFGERVLRRYGLRVPSYLVSNGLPAEFCPGPSPRCPSREGRFVVLSVGRFAVEKQHQLLLEGIRRSRHAAQIQLVLVGDGPLRQRLEGLATRLPVAPIIGPVTRQVLLDHYRSADLYIHSSLLELESLSTLEAMGCGLPVLIADSPLSAAAQFALDPRSLFPARSAAGLAAQLDYWIEHPAERQRAAVAYAAHANRYRLGTSVAQMEQIYYGLLCRRL